MYVLPTRSYDPPKSECSFCRTLYLLKHSGNRRLQTILKPSIQCIFYISVRRSLRPDKGKGHPITGHDGPEVGKRYTYTLSLTSAPYGGGWSTPRPGRFTPGKDTVPTVQEAGWAPGPVWTGEEKSRPHRDSIPGPSIP